MSLRRRLRRIVFPIYRSPWRSSYRWYVVIPYHWGAVFIRRWHIELWRREVVPSDVAAHTSGSGSGTRPFDDSGGRDRTPAAADETAAGPLCVRDDA